jgi:hypothetical protein
MTDQPNSGSASPEPGASSPTPPPPPPLAPLVDQQAGWAAVGEQPAPPPVAPPPAPPAPTSTRGDKIKLGLILGGIVAFLAVVLFVTMNNQSAFDLEVGQCFDLPSQTTDIDTVTKHECAEPHDAEVFFVGDHAEQDAYPGETAFDTYVEANCPPAFQAYVGEAFEDAEEYNYGWFYPTPESWAEADDREVTCYIVNSDESKLSQSVRVGS